MDRNARRGTVRARAQVFLDALKEYLLRPKTLFDFKDRMKALAALIIITFILWRVWQFVLQILGRM